MTECVITERAECGSLWLAFELGLGLAEMAGLWGGGDLVVGSVHIAIDSEVLLDAACPHCDGCDRCFEALRVVRVSARRKQTVYIVKA